MMNFGKEQVAKSEGLFNGQKATKLYRQRRLAAGAIQYIVLFVFWLILSGHYEVMYLIFGAAAAGLITFLTNAFIYPRVTSSGKENLAAVQMPFLGWWCFLAYLPWLLLQIIMANIQVAYLVLHPRMPIKPCLLQFKTKLRRGAAQVTLANSITLTPGTVTIELKDGSYVVHALVPKSAQNLVMGQMQDKAGAVFGEKEKRPLSIRWTHSIREIEP